MGGYFASFPAVFLDGVFESGDYQTFFMKIRESEQNTLLAFEDDYPHVLNESNTNDILEQARRKREQEKPSVRAEGDEYQNIAKDVENKTAPDKKSIDGR